MYIEMYVLFHQSSIHRFEILNFLPPSLCLSHMEYLSLVCVNYGSQNFDCCCTRNFVFDSLITNQTLENENENCLVGKFILREKYFMFQQTEPKSKVSLVNWGDLSFLLIITQRDLPIMFVLLLAQLGDPKHLIG